MDVSGFAVPKDASNRGNVRAFGSEPHAELRAQRGRAVVGVRRAQNFGAGTPVTVVVTDFGLSGRGGGRSN